MSTILVNLPDNARLRRMFLPTDWEKLRALGNVHFFRPNEGSGETFRALLNQADAMLTGWGSRPLTEEDWAFRQAVRPDAPPFLLAHSAGSVRQFVPKVLLEQGVRVSQSASAMAPAVAQWTIGLMILALRQGIARTDAQKNALPKNEELPYRDLSGVTIGLVGLSQVGRCIPPLLAPFGPGRVLAYDPYCSKNIAAALGVELIADLDELCRESDVLSLHAPVTPETRNLLNAHRIGLLQKGAVVINTARAALVDQAALFARARAGEMEYYADVSHPEPLPPDHPAWQNPHVFITPHVGGTTTQALRGMARFAITEMERFLKNEPLRGEITHDRYDLLA